MKMSSFKTEMDEKYSYTKKTQEFKGFQTFLERVLNHRGRRRRENIEVLENYFCKVWCDAQTLHLDQYKELMTDKRKLRNQMRELTEEHDEELTRLEKEIDSSRDKLLTRKQI